MVQEFEKYIAFSNLTTSITLKTTTFILVKSKIPNGFQLLFLIVSVIKIFHSGGNLLVIV